MLRITKQADYALVLLSQFAVGEPGAIHTARGLSGQSRLPLPTVSKILKCLARNGLLSSIRGVNGGYRLARAATAISVADVIGAVDGPIAFTDCLTADDPATCQLHPSCPTRGHWGRINRVVADALTRLPLSEVARPEAHGHAPHAHEARGPAHAERAHAGATDGHAAHGAHGAPGRGDASGNGRAPGVPASDPRGEAEGGLR